MPATTSTESTDRAACVKLRNVKHLAAVCCSVVLAVAAQGHAAKQHTHAESAISAAPVVSVEERMAMEKIVNELMAAEERAAPVAEKTVRDIPVLRGESANYRVDWDVTASGGGVSTSSSYSLVATLGQAAATGFSSSVSYQLEGGFLAPPDTDSDSLRDFLDNCSAQANSDQTDTDGDGIGNACDADFDQSCFVNVVDLVAFKAFFFTAEPLYDLTGDNFVNLEDLIRFKALFFAPPGPTGIDNDC